MRFCRYNSVSGIQEYERHHGGLGVMDEAKDDGVGTALLRTITTVLAQQAERLIEPIEFTLRIGQLVINTQIEMRQTSGRPPDDMNLAASKKAILLTLQELASEQPGRRWTKTDLQKIMEERDRLYAECTLKTGLASLRQSGYILNDGARNPGYYLADG